MSTAIESTHLRELDVVELIIISPPVRSSCPQSSLTLPHTVLFADFQDLDFEIVHLLAQHHGNAFPGTVNQVIESYLWLQVMSIGIDVSLEVVIRKIIHYWNWGGHIVPLGLGSARAITARVIILLSNK